MDRRAKPELKIGTVEDQKKGLTAQIQWDGYVEEPEGSGSYYRREVVGDHMTDTVHPMKASDFGKIEGYVYTRFAITDKVPLKADTGDHFHVEPNGVVWKKYGSIG